MSKKLSTLLILCTIQIYLTGCNPETNYHLDDYEYDIQWSIDILKSSSQQIEKLGIEEIEIFIENSSKGFPQPYFSLSSKDSYLTFSNKDKINEFIFLLRDRSISRPKWAKTSNPNEMIHMVFKGSENRLGYIRCYWKNDSEHKPYGLLKAFNSNSPVYTEGLFPWITKEKKKYSEAYSQ